MTSFVYILYSLKGDRFYVGCTYNIQKRLLQHNNKETPSTASGVPWKLIWKVQKSDRMSAELLERKLKNLSRERKIRFMKKYNEGVQDLEFLQSIE